MMKKAMLAVLAASAMLAAGSACAMDGTVKGSMLSASYVVGFRAGEAMVNVDGVERKVSIHGLSVLSIGLAGGPIKGEIKNVKEWADVEGTYEYAEVGGAYVVGASVSRWVNTKTGVEILVKGLEVGAELRMGPGALRVKFAD